MTNTREQTQEEQRRQFQNELTPATITLQAITEADQRHYTPLHNALPNDGAGYEWKRETGDIQSYQHNQTNGWLHIDPQGQFFDRQAQAISRDQALDHAQHGLSHSVADNNPGETLSKPSTAIDQGISL